MNASRWARYRYRRMYEEEIANAKARNLQKDDGWYSIPCPDCGGTGKRTNAPKEESVAKRPQRAFDRLKEILRDGVYSDDPDPGPDIQGADDGGPHALVPPQPVMIVGDGTTATTGFPEEDEEADDGDL